MARNERFVRRGLPVLLGLMVALAGIGNHALPSYVHTGAQAPAIYSSAAQLACIQTGEC